MANQDRNPGGGNGTQGSSYLYDYGTTPNTRTAVSQKVRILAPVFGATTQALYQVGVVSNFAPSASARSVEEIRGIGFGDMIAELVPSITTAMTATMERALLYLSNICQAMGYASGVDGPVRSLAHHRWPFDVEQQLVFSSLADNDFDAANVGTSLPTSGYAAGTRPVKYPRIPSDTLDPAATGLTTRGSGTPGHSAIITMYEACWMTSWGNSGFAKDNAPIMETAELTISDVHDFASTYGEFLPTGLDPTQGQLGSIRYGTGSISTRVREASLV